MLITRDPRSRDQSTTGLISLEALLRDHRRVALVGPEGSGRSPWLAGLAERCAGRFVSGIDLVLARAVDEPQRIASKTLVCVDASSWMVEEPLRWLVDSSEAEQSVWSVQRRDRDAMAARGFHVAEVEPESYPEFDHDVAVASPSEVLAFAIEHPLHRATLSLVPAPRSIDELRARTVERIVGPRPHPRLLALALRLCSSRSEVDATPPSTLGAAWPALRFWDVTTYLAQLEFSRRTDERDRNVQRQHRPASAVPKRREGHTHHEESRPSEISMQLRDSPLLASTDKTDHRLDSPHLPDFLPLPGAGSLARSPVTVGQYGRFVDSDMVRDPRWWGSQGLPVTFEPCRFTEQRPFAGRPVVGVSWMAAQAYARWLAAETGNAVELASHSLWRAACSTPFPWGDLDDDPHSRANFGQQVGHVTDCESYPLGSGPFGHLDLAGNCWEWLADRAGPHSHIVVGGGWFSKLQYLRSDYQFAFHDENRFRDLGFRVGVPAPIEDRSVPK